MTSSLVLSIVTFVYAFSAVFYIASWIFRKPGVARAGAALAVTGAMGNLAGFLLRWMESYHHGYGHIPLSNLYESLVFFALTVVVVCLYLEWKYKSSHINAFSMTIAFFILAYAALKAGQGHDQIQPLIPALKSNWLTAHVMTCFLGYAGFAIAFGISLIFLTKKSFSVSFALGFFTIILYYLAYTGVVLFFGYNLTLLKNDYPDALIIRSMFIAITLGLIIVITLIKMAFNRKGQEFLRQLSYDILDEITQQTIMFGFLFLTLGIITGSVWANSAWGTYWSWDPKETWSLITWFVYAIFLHLRYVRGWDGSRLAWISVIGFMAVMFTYFGVNFLPGLHSYGKP